MKTKYIITLFFVLCFCLCAKAQNAYRDSLRIAMEALAYHPDSITLRLNKAKWNMLLEEWGRAKNEYDYVLDRNKNNLTALFYRAYANERLNRYGFARLDYQTLLTVAPGNFEGLLGLALLNFKDMKYSDAFDQINQLVALHPDSAIAYAARGGMEKEKGMMELAEYDYAKACQLAPKHEDYLLNLVDIRLTLSHFVEAREELKMLERLGYSKNMLKDFYKRLK